ncbi:MAG TPA: hypothetical protein VM243_02315 [Phycisphaerae bacterium]|nr:hypothetical protein [Phycisphaerae bacterium]
MPEYTDGQTGTGPPPGDLPPGWDVDQQGDNWTIRDRTEQHALRAEYAADISQCREFVQTPLGDITQAQVARAVKSVIRLMRAIYEEIQD